MTLPEAPGRSRSVGVTAIRPRPGSTAEGSVLAARADRLAFALLLLQVAGLAGFNRSFAYLHLGPIYITEAVLASLLLLAALRLRARPAIHLPRDLMAASALVLTLAYLVWGGIRLLPGLFGPAPILDVFRNFGVVHYALFAPLAYYIVGADPGRRLRLLLTAIVACSTITNLVTLGVFVATSGSASVDAYSKIISGQAALFAVFAAAILLARLQFREHRAAGVLALLALQGAFIYLSGHRSAVLALGAVVAVLVVGPNRKALLLAGVGAVMALLLSLVLFEPARALASAFALKYRTLWSGTTMEWNALWRYLYWNRVLDFWSDAPILGHGFVPDLSTLAPIALPPGQERVDPHNSYLTVLARLGIVGLFLLTMSILAGAGALVRRARTAPAPRLRSVALACAASLAAIVVFAAMNVTLEGPYHGIFLWLFLGAGPALMLSPTAHRPDGAAARASPVP